MKKTAKLNPYQLCFLAMAVGINLVGGQLALMLRLPIYLDSIGTILAGAILGPWLGMVPNLLSGIIMGMTVDVYSLYFAPVGMITGFMSGLLLGRKWGSSAGVFGLGRQSGGRAPWLFLIAAGITIPGTAVSSLINAVLFGGITSSGSTILVQLLSRTPLGLTGSIFVVQILTDYADRCISVFAVSVFAALLGREMRMRLRGGAGSNGTV